MSSDPAGLIYLSGPPAVGKSTLMAELTRDVDREARAQPFAHDVLSIAGEPIGVELGRRRDTFSGTDALGMAVNPRAVAWITDRPAGLVLAEGDRLANRGFLGAAHRAGYSVTLVDMVADAATLAARAYARGSNQNPAWVTGRATKAARLADASSGQGWRVIHLDATAPPDRLADQLQAEVPALRRLRLDELRNSA